MPDFSDLMTSFPRIKVYKNDIRSSSAYVNSQASSAISCAGLKNLQLKLRPEAMKAGHGIHGRTDKYDSGILECNGSLRAINKIDSVASVALSKRGSYRADFAYIRTQALHSKR
jgi:hypothetical protein